MEIYLIYNVFNGQSIYFVSSAEIQSQGQALNIPNTVWNIGNINDATNQLNTLQSIYLTSDDAKEHITCTKCIGQTEEGYLTWSACDLLAETDNTDTIYELHTDTNPGFTRATGLEKAKTVYAQKQQDILNWAGLAQIITLSELPLPHKKQTVGAQTF
jgi:hypothetical protein